MYTVLPIIQHIKHFTILYLYFNSLSLPPPSSCVRAVYMWCTHIAQACPRTPLWLCFSAKTCSQHHPGLRTRSFRDPYLLHFPLKLCFPSPIISYEEMDLVLKL